MGQEKVYNRFKASAGQNRIVTHTCLQLGYIHGLSAELPSIVFNPDKKVYRPQQNSCCKSFNHLCNQYPVDRVTQNYIPCLGQRLSKTLPCKAAHPVAPSPGHPVLQPVYLAFSWLIHAFLMKMIESNQQQREANKVFPERANALEKVVPGGGGDTLLYNPYGYVPAQMVCFFSPFWFDNGYRLIPFWSGIGYGFRGRV